MTTDPTTEPSEASTVPDAAEPTGQPGSLPAVFTTQPATYRGELPEAIASEHLYEDSLVAGSALVTLSTFYDGATRATRSVLVAHVPIPERKRPEAAAPSTDPAADSPVDLSAALTEPGPFVTRPTAASRLVIASFELDALDGLPDPEALKNLHLWNANRVAHLLAGEDARGVEHGDLILAVLEAAACVGDAA